MAVETARARQVLEEERAAATARRTELLCDLESVMEGARDVATDDEHDPEGATIAYERSKLMALVRQADEQLAAVGRALARVDAGSYGMCERCGRAIGDARLEARPSASTCVRCT